MTETEPRTWLTRRDDFPWIVEREKLIAEKQNRSKMVTSESATRDREQVLHHAPLSEVLKYARAAREQPEIWEAVESIVKRYRSDVTEDEKELTSDENFFFAYFNEWYLLKHNLPYSADGFRLVPGLLLQIGYGLIPDDLESQEAKAFLLQNPFVKRSN